MVDGVDVDGEGDVLFFFFFKGSGAPGVLPFSPPRPSPDLAISFWLPQIIKAFGTLSNLQIGVITAIPYAIGLVGMVWWSRRSDEKLERKGHTAIALAVAGIFIGLSTVFDSPVPKMACLSIAGFGVFAVLPIFWTLPTA